MPYDLTDRIIEKRKADRERERRQVLSSVRNILEELAPEYGFSKAYIFGSIVKPGRFRRNSDVDIAVFDLKDEDFFRLMAEISRTLERNVKICQMETIDEWLRKRMEAEGVLWKRR